MLEFTFFIVVIIQVFYYFFFFSRFAFEREKQLINTDIPISVIICAKNESANLKVFLPSIINQNHKSFEVILVNDHSVDDTFKIMNEFKDKYSFINVVNLNDDNSEGNKKNAVTQGIKAAKFEYLLFTDADCKPNSRNWISKIATHFNNKKQIVLGYGAHQKKDNSWLNKLIRFETLLTAIQYFSYAKVNLAYMGVGRNLAYKKSLFTSVNGFNSHQHIKSGDDDLFINQVANDNVSICVSPQSFTISPAHTNFKKWIYQKRRHISTANVYKPIHQFLLGLFYISQFLFWFLGLYLLFTSANKLSIILLIFTRLIFQLIIFGFSAKKLKESDLILYLPFLELFLILIQLYIFIQNTISSPKKWNK